MSTTIDERVVEMRFDNKHFEKNVQGTLSTLEKLKQKLNLTGASKGLENINTAASKVDFSGMSNAVDNVVFKFSHLQASVQHVLNGIIDSAINAGKRITSALTIDPIKTGLQEYETQINAVQTILANTESKGTTLQDVNAALDTLNTYADKTIYNFTEMTRNIGTFTAAGVDLETSVSAIQGIANLAAISGSNSQQASTAMYQLSQALASGTVKLMDWNSVVNAGMGGQVFQDALKETARVHGINIDAMIKREGSFRETLKDGWLTSDILTDTLNKFTMAAEEGSAQWEAYKKTLKDQGYTEKQAVAILKMANTATDAATKVKTFTQLWDTLKESVQSGWTQSWETIIGDFGEAKEFLTDISNRLGEMVGNSADSRNKLLTEGLSTGWKQLLGQGISDEEGYKDTIKEVAKEHGVAFDEMIKKTEEAGGTFEDALVDGLKSGKINSDMLSESVHKMSEKMSKMSDKELKAAGYTSEHVKKMQDLSKGLKDGSISMDEFVKKMERPSGRENLIQALWNSFNGLMSVITPIKEAFRDIFPAMTGDQLYSFTERLAKFTEKLKLSEEASKNLKDTFKGIFSIFDMGRKLIITVLDPIAKFLTGSSVSNLGGSILSVTGSIGNFFTKLNEGIKVGEGFCLVSNIIVGALELISDAISMALTGFDGLKKGLSTVWDGISVVIDKITSVLGSAVTWIRENISAGDIFAGLAGGGIFLAFKKIAGMFDNISGFVDKIKDLFKLGKDGASGFSELLGNLNDSLSAFTQGIKTASLVGIAIAITLLTSSIRSLSELEIGEIAVSLLAIRLMIATLNSGFAGLCKTLIAYPAKKTFTAALSLMAMAKAVDILADAMTVISKLSWEELIKGLIGVKVCISALTKSIKNIGQGNITLRTSIAILALAKACQMLSDALKNFATMSWEEIGKGLVAMGGALIEFTAALKIMDKFSGSGALSGSVAMLIASKSLDEISENLKKLGSLSWEEIGKGLSAMGGALAEFGVVLAAMGKISGFSNILAAVGLLIASKSLDEISENLDKLGSMSWEEIGRGLGAMGGVLVELGLVLSEMGRVAGFSNIFAAGAILMVTEGMDEITETLQKIGLMTWEEIARGLSGLGGVLVELGLVLSEMGRVAGFSNIFAAGSILIVTKGLDEISENLKKFGSMSWEEIGRGLAAMGGALVELGVVCGALGKLTGFSGILGSGAIVLVVQGLDPIAEALQKFGSMSWEEIGRGVVAMGAALLELSVTVGALGYLTGFAGLVGAGTITLASQGLGEIADALIKFGSMSWDEIGRGLSAMAGALGTVGLGGILNTFSGLGSLSIATIAEPLGDLADSFKKWGEIKYEDISGGLKAMNVAFAEVAAGGFINTLSGLGSLSIATIAEPLGTLADSVMKWTDVIVPEGLAGQLAALAGAVLEFTFGGLGADAIATAAPGIGQMADSIKKWSDVTVPEGIKDGLTNIAEGVKAFSFAFAGGWSIGTVVTPLGDLAGSISKWKDVTVPEGIKDGLTDIATGVKAFSFAFAGGWSIGAIVEPLASLSESVKKWSDVTVPDSIKDGLTDIANGIEQFTILGAVKLSSIAEPMNILSEAFKRFNGIEGKGESLKTFSENVVSATTKLEEVNDETVTSTSTTMDKLTATMKKVNDTNISNVGKFVDAANKLNDINIGKIEVDTGALKASIEAIRATMNKIRTTIINSKSNINNALKTAVSGMPKCIDGIKGKVDTSVKNILKSVITSIDNYKAKVESSFRTTISAGVSAINGQYSSFVTAGGYLGDGLILGINSKKDSVYWAAYALGQAAVQGEKDGQQSNSPSKATIKAGNWFGEGLVIGIQQMDKKVSNAGYNMGENVVGSISNTLNNISQIINSDIDAQPTIRPVLDLSEVESRAGYLNSMFNNNPSIGVTSNLNAISSGMDAKLQNGTTNDVVYAINKLRKDLSNVGGTTYNVNGVTYDDGSNISTAVKDLVRAAKIERRI